LPMQFATPVPNWIAVCPTPNIYHLVGLKDSYHRCRASRRATAQPKPGGLAGSRPLWMH